MIKSVLPLLVLGSAASGAMAYAASGPTADVELTRLDCGTIQVADLNRFSDTHAYPGKSMRLTDSCYLIRHGDELMLWDTGLSAELKAHPARPGGAMTPSVTRTLAEQLARLRISPAEIKLIGISHYHGDHVGQAAGFANARLLIGQGDWDALTARPPRAGADPKPLAPWIEGRRPVEPVRGDKDVFGDGSVVMLATPGHTPGHHSLLVRLKGRGPVILTGDVAHFRENYATDGVPTFNTDRAASIASLERVKRMATNMKATVVIQHDPRDIGKLPPFPQAAR